VSFSVFQEISMFKDMSKGGHFGFSRQQENVNILLIGNYASDADVLRRELTIIMGLSHTAWYCSDLEEALVFLGQREHRVALVFVDLSLFDGSLPKENFLRVRQKTPDTPIIALADQTSDSLIHYAMENGATDHLSRAQIRGEPDSLRKSLEPFYAQNETARKTDKNSFAASLAANDHDGHQSQDVSTGSPPPREAVNIKLLQDGGKLSLKNVTQKESAADMRAAHAYGNDLLLHQLKERDAVILNISGENVKLRSDLRQSDLDLDESHLKGDVILKYAQDKGAIELNAARDEIRELRKNLLEARDYQPGGCLWPPDSEG
jgi:DNA-binding NarL/FixJ family response regulator